METNKKIMQIPSKIRGMCEKLKRHILDLYILDPEHILKKFLLKNLDRIEPFSKYPYVFQDDWEVVQGYSQYGIGDLVLTNEAFECLVVEIKFIGFEQGGGRNGRNSRNRKKKRVREQASYYAERFKKIFPRLKVEYAIFTDETIFFWDKKLYQEYKDFQEIEFKNITENRS